MNKFEFIRKVNSLPWADRACSFDAVDCWGLVVLYFRHVSGIEIHQTPDYEAGEDFITCYEGDRIFWRAGSRKEGNIAVFYRGERPDHVGIVIGSNRCLHSRGEGEGVRIDPLPVLERAFTKTEFLQYGDI
ncbi:NlpC/P60 family protein [Enterobacter roggenkampii]|uniref:NlpC/P60 family protein n=1 Tax=Enterobacter roggenkampii TaxID=1812935 RepID=UPI0032B0017D